MARLRRPPVRRVVELFDRSPSAWIALGQFAAFDQDTAAPPLTLPERARALIEASALTVAELDALEAAAAGEQRLAGLTADAAAGLLARWRGPIPGLKLRPLPHWPAEPTTERTEQ